MPIIPPSVLKKLYVKGSLRVEDTGFAFDLKNLVAPATIAGFNGLDLDGRPLDGAQVRVVLPSGKSRPVSQISSQSPLPFSIGTVVTLYVADEALQPGSHEITLHVDVKEIGPLQIPVSDTIP